MNNQQVANAIIQELTERSLYEHMHMHDHMVNLFDNEDYRQYFACSIRGLRLDIQRICQRHDVDSFTIKVFLKKHTFQTDDVSVHNAIMTMFEECIGDHVESTGYDDEMVKDIINPLERALALVVEADLNEEK